MRRAGACATRREQRVTTLTMAVILAGGEGARMGGDKALRDLGGAPLIARAIERLRPQVRTVVINANSDPSRFSAFDAPVIADARAGAGPLAGVLAAICHARAAQDGATHVLTAPCDAPFLPADFAARLLSAAAGDPCALAAAASQGRLHPVAALWPLSLHDALTEALDRGERRATEFARAHGAIAVDFPLASIGGATVDPFDNLNTREDLARAEALLAGVGRAEPMTKS
jgi:molybdopterin-guanine dinucleotide biosynthesis protein A